MSAKNNPIPSTTPASPSEITYADKVGSMLLSLAIHQVFKLDGQVKATNRDEFVKIVKSYIDRDFGHKDGWEILFSKDYSALKKIPREKSVPIAKAIYEAQNISPEILEDNKPGVKPAPEPSPPISADTVVRVGFPILPKHRPSDPNSARHLKQFCFLDVLSIVREFSDQEIQESQFENYVEQIPLFDPSIRPNS